MRNKLNISIADINIELFTQNNKIELLLSENYASFQENTATPDIIIEVILKIPSSFLSTKEIYKAKHNGSNNDSAYFWSIHNFNTNEKILFTSNPGNLKFPYMALLFSEKNKNWQLYINDINKNNEDKIYPFIYPMGPLIMYYAATYNNAFMIHASGVELNNNGYFFSGVSGIGKSTMAKLWNEKGANIINDDRLIIRELNGDFYIFNTPMYYPDKSKKCRLNKIFLLKQSLKNREVQLFGAKAISDIMVNCIHHNYDKNLLNNLLTLLTKLVKKTKIYELGFIPNISVVDYILKNE